MYWPFFYCFSVYSPLQNLLSLLRLRFPSPACLILRFIVAVDFFNSSQGPVQPDHTVSLSEAAIDCRIRRRSARLHSLLWILSSEALLRLRTSATFSSYHHPILPHLVRFGLEHWIFYCSEIDENRREDRPSMTTGSLRRSLRVQLRSSSNIEWQISLVMGTQISTSRRSVKCQLGYSSWFFLVLCDFVWTILCKLSEILMFAFYSLACVY